VRKLRTVLKHDKDIYSLCAALLAIDPALRLTVSFMCCSVSQCVAVRCSMWQCVKIFLFKRQRHLHPLRSIFRHRPSPTSHGIFHMLQRVATCCSVLQRVATCHSLFFLNDKDIDSLCVGLCIIDSVPRSPYFPCVAVCCSLVFFSRRVNLFPVRGTPHHRHGPASHSCCFSLCLFVPTTKTCTPCARGFFAIVLAPCMGDKVQ